MTTQNQERIPQGSITVFFDFERKKLDLEYLTVEEGKQRGDAPIGRKGAILYYGVYSSGDRLLVEYICAALHKDFEDPSPEVVSGWRRYADEFIDRFMEKNNLRLQRVDAGAVTASGLTFKPQVQEEVTA